MLLDDSVHEADAPGDDFGDLPHRMLGEAPEWTTKWAKAQEDDHLLDLPKELGES